MDNSIANFSTAHYDGTAFFFRHLTLFDATWCRTNLTGKAVMIGRAYLWGLAANGQAGVENVLDVLRGGIDSALLGLGKANVSELTRDDVVAPPDFFRTLGK
jgi:hypothetical protein